MSVLIKSIPWAWLLMALLLVSACQGAGGPEYNDDHSVPSVDLARYAGKWYSIASLPAPFQDDCFCTTAEYILEKGRVRVINHCRRQSARGRLDQAEGIAIPVPGSRNSRLRVSFFRPFFGDYWVIALDPSYQWAMVGHPQRKYLWILSRSPRLAEEVYQRLVAQARALGYPVGRLDRTDQSCNAPKP